jgi:hypothetical protein
VVRRGALGIHASAQEVLAFSDRNHDAHVRRLGGAEQGVSGRAIHIYDILISGTACHDRTRHLGLLPR